MCVETAGQMNWSKTNAPAPTAAVATIAPWKTRLRRRVRWRRPEKRDLGRRPLLLHNIGRPKYLVNRTEDPTTPTARTTAVPSRIPATQTLEYHLESRPGH